VKPMRWTPWTAGFLALALLAPASGQERWADPADVPAWHHSLITFFQGLENRPAGSPANRALETKVERLFAESGFPHGEIRFPAMRFIPGPATMTLPNGRRLTLHAMHPTWLRPGNFPERVFSAPLTYLGRGDIPDLQAASGLPLENAVAVLEFNSGNAWEHLLRFGIRGFVFLGDEPLEFREAAAKVSNSEVAVPRYYLEPAEASVLRDTLAEGRSLTAHFDVEPSRWERVEARTLWVIIPGADPQLAREMPVFVAPLDGNNVVPALGQSARAGANLYLLIRLLEHFRNDRPARSVMLAAVNAHTQYFLGERTLAWYLLAPPADIESVRNTLAADLRVEELYVNYYSRLALDGAHDDADSDLLIRWRSLTDDSVGRLITIKEPIVARAKRDVNGLKGDRARLEREKDRLLREARRFREANEPARSAELEQNIRDLERRLSDMAERQAKFVNVLTLFNKAGVKTVLADLSEEERQILRDYVREIVETNRRAAELDRQELETSLANAAIRQATQSNTIPFVLTFELTFDTPFLGLSSFAGVIPSRRWAPSFGVNAVRIAQSLPEIASQNKPNRLVDTLTFVGGLPEQHFIRTATPAVGFFHAAGQTPAFSLATPYVGFGSIFTPADRFDRLDPEAVAEILAFAPRFLKALLDDRTITRSTELQRPPQDFAFWSTQIKTYKFDEFAASVLPQIPVPDTLIALYAAEPRKLSGEIPNIYSAMTDERASALFYGLREKFPVASAAYRMTPDWTAVDHVIDAGESHSKVPSQVSRGTPTRRFALIPCVEFPLYSFQDTSLISAGAIDVSGTPYLLLSGAKNASPRRFGMMGIASVYSAGKVVPPDLTGPGAFYLHPEERIKVITAKKRLAINATPEEPTGIGYRQGEMNSDFFRDAVRDMIVLNAHRLSGMKGVTDELAQDFLHRARESAARMEEAIQRRQPVTALRELASALGAVVKSYQQTASTTNDMLKAVLFYMALLLPFCFFLEKMLFTVSRIEAEMGLFAALFVGTFLLFRLIHPAFQIAQYPEAIFLGFLMLALGLFVIMILHSRFEAEMQMLVRTLSASEYAEVGYSTVSQQAMLIGVNNMKKRRIRTALTTATIVLVTFTMLSFTSISRRLAPTLVARGPEAPYTGILFHWPGNARMDDGTTYAIRAMFADRADIIERYWWLPEKVGGVAVPLRIETESGRAAQIEAILGLMPAEDGFLQPMPLVAGRFFERDNADEVILPASLARVLGVTPEAVGTSQLIILGRPFRVVGILDEERFRTITDLNERPLIPIKDLIRQVTGMGTDGSETGRGLSEEEMDESGVFYAETSALLLMPAQTARRLGALPYSLSIRLHDESAIWPAADELLTATSAKFFMGSRRPFVIGEPGKGRENKPGIFYIGSNYRTSIGGLAMLIIPLLIASTIILNTMLGSVFERKREIAIYNAVGLNPTHIGLFFLAESFVYGVIGSVGGYLIGQFLSLALNRFGLVSDINLNFSSLAVAYVIVFTIAVTLLSTLYPAIVATKAAVPSGKRTWSMPPTDGQRMEVVFPFIYQEALLPGIMRYLEEFLAQFTEASMGDLIARLNHKEKTTDAEGRPVFRLDYDIALAPFDLGVTQRTRFEAAYDPVVQAYRVAMKTERLSGQDTNWITTNKPFLEKLRKHMMQWRNLDAAQHALYIQQGVASFA